MKKKRQKSTKKSHGKHNNKRSQKTSKTKTQQTQQSTASHHLVSAKYQFPKGRFSFFNIIQPSRTTQTLISINFNLATFFLSVNSTLIRSLDDKTKYLHNIQAKVMAIIQTLVKPKQITSIQSSLKKSPTEVDLNTKFRLTSKSNPDFTKTTNLISFNEASYTQSCANIFLNESQNNYLKNEPKSRSNKSRPSYIIERDCHIFGGCIDDDADDEFFISSGAVYQSWPYIYEPGFRIKPLPYHKPFRPFSLSDKQINYSELDIDSSNSKSKNTKISSYELPSYSLDNYDINFFHNNNNSTFSTYSSSDLSQTETSDDDSDSYRAYKHRHAVGLACFNNNNNNNNSNTSQSSLSDLGLKKAYNLLSLTDSSSCDEIAVSKKGLIGRLTTSVNVREAVCGNEKRGRFFLSCANNQQYCSCNNLIF